MISILHFDIGAVNGREPNHEEKKGLCQKNILNVRYIIP